MKSLLIFLLAVGLTFSINAQSVYTVQGEAGTSSYSTLTAAVAGASAGDYIYLPGGTVSVTDLIINKQLHLIGAGHYPEASSATGATILTGNVYFNTGSDFSTIQGLFLNNEIRFGMNGDNDDVSNILISRCNVSYIHLGVTHETYSGVSNIHIKDCIIRAGISFKFTQNNVVDNCIIEGVFDNVLGGLEVNNCIFFNPGQFLRNINAAMFKNCIFTISSSNFTYASHSQPAVFQNCLFGHEPVSDNINTQYYNCAQFTGSANLLFENMPENKFDYSYDYHLASGSEAAGFGLEDTDAGIYGGMEPYKEDALPINPHIVMKNIPGKTDGQGKLNITVQVQAQDF